MWGPVVTVLDEWGPPRDYRESRDTLGVVEVSGAITGGKKKPDGEAVAAAMGRLLARWKGR